MDKAASRIRLQIRNEQAHKKRPFDFKWTTFVMQ